jgi:multiple sugar transport system substrate-binding protein
LLLTLLLLTACAHQRDTRIHLRFWHAWGGYEQKVLNSLVDEYNAAHPNIIVEPSFLSIGDKLLASIAGGKPPDIATVWTYMITPMGDSGCFLPLEERFAAAGITESDYLPNVWQHGVTGKHRWGIATTLNTNAIYYNTRVVREAGLDPDHPPQTIAELESWAEKLTKLKPDGTIERLGYVPSLVEPWLYNFGGDQQSSSTGKLTLDDPNNVRAYAWMKRMYDKVGGIQNFRRLSLSVGKPDSPENPLFVGKIAMKEDGQWVVQFFREYAPQVEFGVFAMPPEKKGDTGWTNFGGSFWCIPVGSKHPDQAWEFLRWLSAPDQSARLCAALKNIPPMKAALDHPAFRKAREDDKFDFFVRLIAEGKARPPLTSPVSQLVREAFDNGSELVFSGALAPEIFLRDLQRRANDELKRSAVLLGTEER